MPFESNRTKDGSYIFLCRDVGVSGTTNVILREVTPEGKYIGKVGISILGHCNMTSQQLDACNRDPWHPNFFDNAVVGRGNTIEECLEDIRKQIREIADSIWST